MKWFPFNCSCQQRNNFFSTNKIKLPNSSHSSLSYPFLHLLFYFALSKQKLLCIFTFLAFQNNYSNRMSSPIIPSFYICLSEGLEEQSECKKWLVSINNVILMIFTSYYKWFCLNLHLISIMKKLWSTKFYLKLQGYSKSLESCQIITRKHLKCICSDQNWFCKIDSC